MKQKKQKTRGGEREKEAGGSGERRKGRRETWEVHVARRKPVENVRDFRDFPSC